MTTYLLTHRGLTLPFCSALCRATYAQMSPRIYKNDSWRDDDRWEFDEKCMNCGAVVPAGCVEGEG